jgi:DNA-binding ferritin-like protein
MTNSYAQHKALEKYYEKIVPLLDDWAEAGSERLRPISGS